jgi:hypothetical protein
MIFFDEFVRPTDALFGIDLRIDSISRLFDVMLGKTTTAKCHPNHHL